VVFVVSACSVSLLCRWRAIIFSFQFVIALNLVLASKNSHIASYACSFLYVNLRKGMIIL